MGMLDVITRVLRLDEGVKEIIIDDNESEPSIIIDSELSTVSKNPVQNKVITNRIYTIEAQIDTLEEQIDTKQDASPYIRKIYIGDNETPDESFGEEGDIYIYLPTQ